MGESPEGTPLGNPIGEIHWEFRVTSLGEHIAAFLTLLTPQLPVRVNARVRQRICDNRQRIG